MDESKSIRSTSAGFMISVGTQVVLKVSKISLDSSVTKKPGSVGFISACPDRADGSYRVEFTDGKCGDGVL